jgi:hypothetical protein
MNASNVHYLLAVSAPGIGFNLLRTGAWAIMANAEDLAELETRKTSAAYALTPFRGQVAVFRMPLDNPEEARLEWSHNLDKTPDLGTMITPTPEQRETFWAYVEQVQQRMAAQAAGVTLDAPGGPQEKRAGALKWWLLGAATICGLMIYAVCPELFHEFNWQGRLYETVDIPARY